jgi:tryptophanyl-tRNA synthetase
MLEVAKRVTYNNVRTVQLRSIFMNFTELACLSQALLFSNSLTIECQLRGILGITPEDHIGKVSFPPVQAAPSFPSSFPHLFPGNDQLRCLIPCAIHQVQYLV